MLDGRHVGTGGGNHVVMGAAAPEDSPFLRRPDLLKSLLGFWHNHPSLSFLFSGLFIGPTSQHPRIDEARDDAVNELEIAFEPDHAVQQPVPPWLTDRMFRNILADMTGNTHRTEFCIDKMYDPNGASGRRGLVEFRAFEMPPHARMSAAQMLLMRAAVAAFWQQPVRAPAGPLGHPAARRVHAAALLSSRISATRWRSFGQLGFRLDPAWFAPHFEFRFPHDRRDRRCAACSIELRHALEPWHVLGEEQARRRHRALRRQLGRAGAGQGHRLGRRALRAGLQRRGGAADAAPSGSANTSPACASRPGRRRARCTRPSRRRRRWCSTSTTAGPAAAWAA